MLSLGEMIRRVFAQARLRTNPSTLFAILLNICTHKTKRNGNKIRIGVVPESPSLPFMTCAAVFDCSVEICLNWYYLQLQKCLHILPKP